MANSKYDDTFSNAVKENQKINPEFNNLVFETLNGIYEGLGEKNFLRWIDKNYLSDRLKQLVVEVFSEQDKIDHPNAAGFYTSGTNKIKLHPEYIDENVNRHETIHFITDFSFSKSDEINFLNLINQRYGTFLNEGLTEYLNRELEKIKTGNVNVAYSYVTNVDFVEILHNIMGDFLIKSFLKGRTEKSDEGFSTYLSEDGKPNKDLFLDFNKLLDQTHIFLHSDKSLKSNKTPEEEKEYTDKKNDLEKNVYPEIRKYINNITVNYFRKKAHNLEYIENGKVNPERIIKDIENIDEKIFNFFRGKKNCFGLDFGSQEFLDFQNKIMNNAINAIFQELSIDKIENQNVDSWIIPSRNVTYSHIDVSKLRNITNNLNEMNLFNSIITNRKEKSSGYSINGKFDLTSFLMDMSLIIEKFNFDEKTKKSAIDIGIALNLPDNINEEFVRNIINKYSSLISKFSQMNNDDIKGVVETHIFKISNDLFVQKRDNRTSLIHIDEKKQDVINVGGIERYWRTEKLLNTVENQERKKCYKIERNYISKNQHSIICNPDFSKVEVDNRPVIVMDGYSRLMESFVVSEAIKEFLDDPKKYSIELNDDKSLALPNVLMWCSSSSDIYFGKKNTAILNFRKVRDDIEKIMQNLPENYRDSILYFSLSEILKSVYGANLDDFPEIIDIIKDKDSSKDEPSEKWIKRALQFTERINKHKRSLKNGAIGFFIQNEDDQKKVDKYNVDIKRMERNDEINRNVRYFQITHFDECIVQSDDNRKFDNNYIFLEGVEYQPKSNNNYIFLEGIEYQEKKVVYKEKYESGKAREVDYQKLCDLLKDEIEEIPESDRKDYLTRVMNTALRILLWLFKKSK